MTQRYELRYRVSDALLKRAMTSWARPQRGLKENLLRFAGLLAIGAAIGAVVVLTGLDDRVPSAFWIGALAGFYAGLLFWFFSHKRDLKRLAGFGQAARARQGESRVTLTAEAVEMTSDIGASRVSWQAYDQVIRMADASVLRAGAVVYPIPHDALPDGVTPEQFHADIVAWQEAAQ
jgi:hypothetical protein